MPPKSISTRQGAPLQALHQLAVQAHFHRHHLFTDEQLHRMSAENETEEEGGKGDQARPPSSWSNKHNHTGCLAA